MEFATEVYKFYRPDKDDIMPKIILLAGNPLYVVFGAMEIYLINM